ncbi:O-antigen ligase family protein [Methylobacterium sp. ID0610]|uniref:O-antigen ligase family protein n=1 Tax=Methylobacterium carpenticola TaxID=3344827 RepID=UPI00368D2E0B
MGAIQYRALRDDPRVGFWTAVVIAAILAVWRLGSFADASGGSQTKYILYVLPLACLVAQVCARRFVVPISAPGLQAVGLYLLAVGASLAVSRSTNAFTLRDVLIIATYLLMFGVSWSASPREVLAMGITCFVCMAIEAFQDGISFNVDILDSDGILESVMAFPLGVIVLYCIRTRRLGPGILATLLFFAAYKRIAILAVIGVVAFEWGLALVGLAHRRRAVATTAVIVLSILSLFSARLFEFAAVLIGGEHVSANSVSLGRFEFAQAIWRQLDAAPLLALLFGHGPGSADSFVQAAIDNASNPHNDWLKIFVDYGVFGFVVMHLVLRRIFAGGAFATSVHLYTVIVMMTDNVLIYTFHHAIVLVVMRAAAPLAARATRPAMGSAPDVPAPMPR